MIKNEVAELAQNYINTTIFPAVMFVSFVPGRNEQ